jgi:type IV pilus assembly protein PilY1
VTSVYDATATAGRAIFLIDVKTGKVLAEKKFDAAATDGQKSMYFSIVSNPTVLDLDFDGFADVVYVGDMGGQIFKWAIHDVGEDRVNDASGLRTQPNWPFKVFFRTPPTVDGATTYFRNFFFSPAATFVGSKLWLAFGTGERRSLPFVGVPPAVDENNRFYVVSDPDPFERAVSPLGTATEADLLDITGDEDGATFAGRGYLFKVQDGEKFVTNVEIFAGQVIAASFLPTPSADPCAGLGGRRIAKKPRLRGEERNRPVERAAERHPLRRPVPLLARALLRRRPRLRSGRDGRGRPPRPPACAGRSRAAPVRPCCPP